ncbi:MAG: 3-phosphoshikimate 1-carboxyvinyltransferase [Microthrixaceae bacterium]
MSSPESSEVSASALPPVVDDPLAGLPDVLEVAPLTGPLDARVRPPGSKSVTNRALVCAALAHGTTTLRGVLVADDTEAMLQCLHGLGVPLRLDRGAGVVEIEGNRGRFPEEGALLDARMSGTTSRFIAPVAALGGSTVVLDGAPQLRGRPMGELFDALRTLGAGITPLGEPDHLPVQIDGRGLEGGTLRVRGDVSSQFLSALLLSAPEMRRGLEVEVVTELVSRPYVELTLDVMAGFGAASSWQGEDRIRVEGAGYRSPTTFDVEPDASAASYFFAAAALCGGSVTVEGLGTGSQQGDVAFVDALQRMGAGVERGADHVTVTGTGELQGIEIDMSDISDTAQTLAVLAPFASSPTRVTGIGFIRHKETDRVGAVVTELSRLGVDAREEPDGFVIHPGTPTGGVVQTYEDHRMAMSFALIGLRVPGIRIAEPSCVAKTFPGFWQALDGLRGRR